MTIFKTKAFFLTYFAILLLGTAWWYVGQYVYRSHATASTVNITFSPPSGSLGSSDTINVIITAQGASEKIDAFDLTFTTGGSARITGFGQPKDLGANTTFGQVVGTPTTGTSAHVVYVAATDKLQDADLPHSINLPIKVQGSGAGTVTLDTTKSVVNGRVESHKYVFGQANPSGSYTFSGSGGGNSGGGGGNMNLNLALSFQGIVTKPAHDDTMNVRAKLVSVSKGVSTDYQSGSFTSDDKGIFHGTISLNASDASDYYVLVKGPQHMAKKVCDSAPTESATGTYRCSIGKLNLTAGDNTLDFSKIRMLVGDLPTQGGDPASQDGVVDSFDVSFIRQNLGSHDEGALAIGDLNRDGVIDSQDFSLIIASLGVKYDEQ